MSKYLFKEYIECVRKGKAYEENIAMVLLIGVIGMYQYGLQAQWEVIRINIFLVVAGNC